MPGFVRTEAAGAVHVVHVDDGAVNALTLELLEDLGAAITAAGPDTALVIAGRPGCLTAGLDRAAMLSGDRASVSQSLRRVTVLYEQILEHPAPTVIAGTGHALAAGALLLLVADARIGARIRCKVGFNETQIGLPLGPLAVAAARARLAPQSLVHATLHAAVHDADSALRVGFLDELADADDVVGVAVERAARLAALDRRAYLRTRELVWAPVRAEVAAALARRPPSGAAHRPPVSSDGGPGSLRLTSEYD